MERDKAIKKILEEINQNDVLITSTGFISREVYWIKDSDRTFYMMGSMGMALALGIGIAYSRKDLNVLVISGDGGALMELGTMVLMKKLALFNLKYYILDNNCYDSTGGQKSCSDVINFENLSSNVFVKKVEKSSKLYNRVPLKPREITKRFMEAIKC